MNQFAAEQWFLERAGYTRETVETVLTAVERIYTGLKPRC